MRVLHPGSPPLRPLPCSAFSQSGVGGLLKLSPSEARTGDSGPLSYPQASGSFLCLSSLGGLDDPPLVTALPRHLLSISSALLFNPNGDGLQTRGMRGPLGVPCRLDQRASSTCSPPLAVSPPAAPRGLPTSPPHSPLPPQTSLQLQSAADTHPTLPAASYSNKDVYSFNHQIKCLTSPSPAPGSSPLQLHLAGQWREKKRKKKREKKIH